MKRRINIILFAGNIFSFLVIFLVLAGCSSSKGALKFSTLEYPTSMSAFLFDSNYHVVMKGKELESLYEFRFKKTFWCLSYGLIPLSHESSISDSLNNLVKIYGGDGIINLSITIEQGVINKIFSIFMYLPSYVPVFPGSADITVSGEVVRLKKPVI